MRLSFQHYAQIFCWLRLSMDHHVQMIGHDCESMTTDAKQIQFIRNDVGDGFGHLSVQFDDRVSENVFSDSQLVNASIAVWLIRIASKAHDGA